MKKFLALSLLVVSVASSAFATDLYVGADYKNIPECGQFARAKATYSKSTNELVLRVCDNVSFSCMFPVLLNTNAKYEVSKDGKTEQYFSKFSAGVKVNGSCQDFNMNFSIRPGQRNLRAKIGEQKFDIVLY